METNQSPQPAQPTEPKHLARGQSSSGRNWPKVVLAAVLGFGLLFGAAYAGYWYGTESAKLKTQSAKPQLKTQIPETPTPTPVSLIKDETKGWKIYRSEEYGFEFKHPRDWEIEENLLSQSLRQDPRKIVNFHTARAIGPNFQDWESVIFSAEVYDKRRNIPIENWFAAGLGKDLTEAKKGGIEKALERAYAGEEVFHYTEYRKGGIFVYEINRIWSGHLLSGRYLTTEESDYMYGLVMFLSFEENEKIVEIPDKEYVIMFDQILSTFKFLD